MSETVTTCEKGGTQTTHSYLRVVDRRPQRFWTVRCTCGFTVRELSAEEAADDVRKWHLGLPNGMRGWV